jgi:hypothetical protein
MAAVYHHDTHDMILERIGQEHGGVCMHRGQINGAKQLRGCQQRARGIVRMR